MFKDLLCIAMAYRSLLYVVNFDSLFDNIMFDVIQIEIETLK
jgi:hypothetical protein